MDRRCQVIALTPAGRADASLAIAATRAGFLGLLNAEIGPLPHEALAHLAAHARGPFGLKVPRVDAGVVAAVEAHASAGLDWLVLDAAPLIADPTPIARLRQLGVEVLVELTEWDDRLIGLEGPSGLIVKGHEAGGRVGEETSFILLQKALERQGLPVFVRGGVGVNGAAAVMAAGAAGVILDDQLLLTEESPLGAGARAALAGLTGLETALLGEDSARWRVFEKPGFRHVRALRKTIAGQTLAGEGARLDAAATAAAVTGAVGWDDAMAQILPVGQAVAFAAPLAARYRSVGRLMRAVAEAAIGRGARAASLMPFGPGAGVASSHGTTYPIVQGPMTRVSDTAGFAQAVAEGGGLPMLALALMRPEQVDGLLAETARRLDGKPWGVGLLGFAPAELIAAQMEVARKYVPRFALIAGGRPDQAASFEAEGIVTYLHVPSPRLLTMFLEQGARRFVFEGRECGGHVGPLSSLVLWEVMVETMLAHVRDRETASTIHVLFAGGIHDARSAALVAALAAPLAELGVKLGVLMGTAYLFTQEIVAGGGIVAGFQEEALACAQTVTLETGPGHASRAAMSPFAEHFFARRKEMEAEGRSADEIRDELESFTLGRLRVASKGTERAGLEGKIRKVPAARQKAEGMYMIGQVATLRDAVVTVADLHAAVSEGARAVLEGASVPAQAAQGPKPNPVDIAIIGVGGVFPKAGSVREYWENILGRVDAITEIPGHRWDWRLYFDEDRTTPDKIYSRWGGFLDDVLFDPLRYGIPPKAISSIDPLQLMTLEVVRAVLDDAGLSDIAETRERVSLILGASGGAGDVGAQYAVRSELPRFTGTLDAEAAGRLPTWSEDSFAGILLNVAAGRAANRFDMGGVNFTVDAACASSLAAVYQAVLELETGRSDVVLAGGVDTVQGPFGYLCFSKTQALSPRGRCSTFDAAADGIVISEGIAMVALKRLADAERDGDRVYAVIKGVGGSSDGHARSMTAPHPDGQIRAMRRAYEMAGYSPSTVGLFEAHGTGTAAGDAAELETVTRLLGEAGAGPRNSAIGSVKTLIGHTKATAGVAGLIKAALAVHHGVLPPHGKLETPNRTIADEACPLYVLDEARPWVTDGQVPRRASVSAFGFGGTNFHVTLEAHEDAGIPRPAPAAQSRWPHELLMWRGADAPALAAAIRRTAEALARPQAPELRDLAFTLAATAPAQGLTATLVAARGEDLPARLTALAAHVEGAGALPPGAAFTAAPALVDGAEAGKLAFVFPGQGSQYPGMLRHTAMLFPVMRRALSRADAVLKEEMAALGLPGGRLSRAIFPAGAYSEAQQAAAAQALTRTDVAQPALGAVEAGLAALMAQFGVTAAMTAGHSYGELVALHAAGVYGYDALLRASAARGRAMVEGAKGGDLGTMLAVRAGRAETEAAIAGLPDLVIANHNAPRQTILSGTRAAIDAAAAALTAAGLSSQPIAVAAAFHSPLVAPARESFAGFLSGIDFADAAVPVYANASAAPYPAGAEAARETLAGQLVTGVEFVAEIEAMYAAGARVFLTLGPKAIHAGMIRQILEGRPHRAIATDDEAGGLQGLLGALGALLAEGARLDLAPLWSGRDVIRLDARSLVPAARAPVPEKHMWWLNGSGAHRVGTEPRRPLTLEEARSLARPPAELIAPASASAPPPAAMVAAPAEPQRAVTNGAATNGFRRTANGGRGAMSDHETPEEVYYPADGGVMGDFQMTMQRFLATQESVLLAYLGAPQRPAALPARPAPRPIAARPAPTLVPARMPARPAPVAAPVAPPVAAPMAAPVPAAAPAPAPAPVAAAPAPVVAAPAPAAPAPAPAAARLDTAAVAEMLLALVEDRTGYPRDMLGLDQKLEADLGIDSIKRVEIVGALVKQLPAGAFGSTEGLGEKLNACKTLQGMIDVLGSALGGSSGSSGGAAAIPAGAAALPFDATGADSALAAGARRPPRFLIRAEAEPLPATPVRLPEGLYVLTDDGAGLADALAARIVAAGGGVRLLAPAEAEAQAADLATNAAVRGLVHLAPVSSPVHPLGEALAAWRADIAVNEALAHRLLKALGPSLREGGRVLLASRLGGRFGRDGASGGIALAGGGPGLAKSAQEEWPAAIAKAVDLDPALPLAAQADQLFAELAAPGGRREVGYPGGVRTVFRSQPAEIAGGAARALPEGAVILATGGARGITAETLRPLARPGVTLVLAGRSPLPGAEEAAFAGASTPAQLRAVLIAQARAAGQAPKPAEMERGVQALLRDREIRANLAEMEAAGARLVYRAVDVSDPAAATALVAGIRAEFGRLDGVLHGAGVIEDKLILDKDPASWARVVETKAMSALALAAALDPAALSFFVLFGSVAGRYGNSGQSDYAAANELLNRLASQLRAVWPERVKLAVLNWGPWLGTRHGPGMVSEETRRKFEAKGVGLVPPEGGAQACLDEILSGPAGDVEIVIGEGPWERHEAEMGALAATPAPASPASPAPAAASSPAADLSFPHLPLLAGAAIGPGARGGRLITRTLSLERDLYLSQHRIDGVPVLPAAAALELAAQAASAVWPGWQVAEVSELRQLSGVKLEGDAAREIELHVLGSEHGDAAGFSATVELRAPGGRPHYRVALKIADALEEARPLGWTLEAAPAPFDARTAYRDMLFHGPCFQVVTRLEGLDAGGIVAQVRGSSPASFVTPAPAQGGWLFDPALVDAAAQLAWVWSCARRDAAALPNRFGRVRRFRGAGAPARMLFALQPGLPEHQVAADVAVLDAQGLPVFVIEELESTANAGLNRLRGYAGDIRV